MTLEGIVVAEAAVYHSVALEVTEEARRLVVVTTVVMEDSVEVEAVDLEEDSEEDSEAELEAGVEAVEVVVPQFPPSQEQYQYPFPSLIQSP